MNQSTHGLNDNEMDDLFRVANAETTPIPPFQESFWNEMEALLPTRKKKAFFWWWWFPASAAFVTGLIWMVVLLNSAADSERKALVQHQKTTIEKVENNQKQAESDFKSDNHIDEKASTDILKSDQIASNKHNSWKQNKSVSEKRTTTFGLPTNASNKSFEDLQSIEGLEKQESNTLFVSNELNQNETFKLSRIDWKTQLFQIPTSTFNVSEKEWKQSHFYTQIAVSVGQSYQKEVSTKSQMVLGTSLAIGLRKQISNLELTAGLQARIESYDNVQFNENSTVLDANGNTAVMNSLTRVRQMVSIEFPLSMGFHANRHLISWNFNPGIQLYYAGNRLITDSNMQQSREKIAGSVKYSKTVTMELGAFYFYQLNENWMLGGGINADILRPFNPNFYDGKSNQFPINGQIMLRKTF